MWETSHVVCWSMRQQERHDVTQMLNMAILHRPTGSQLGMIRLWKIWLRFIDWIKFSWVFSPLRFPNCSYNSVIVGIIVVNELLQTGLFGRTKRCNWRQGLLLSNTLQEDEYNLPDPCCLIMKINGYYWIILPLLIKQRIHEENLLH